MVKKINFLECFVTLFDGFSKNVQKRLTCLITVLIIKFIEMEENDYEKHWKSFRKRNC